MFKVELNRFLKKKSNIMILIIACMLTIVTTVLATNSTVYIDEEGIEHKNFLSTRELSKIRNIYKGDITSEKIVEIVNLNQKIEKQYGGKIPNKVYAKYLQPAEEVSDMINGVFMLDQDYDPYAIDSLSNKQAKNLYNIYKANKEQKIKEYGTTEAKKEFIEKIYKENTPFYYASYETFETLFNYIEPLSLILVILIVLPVAGIFADEFKTKADSIYFSSKYGKNKMIINKIKVGLVATSLFYLINIGIFTIVSFAIMGISGFNVVNQFTYLYSCYNVTMIEQYLLMILAGYIAILLSAVISMLVGAKHRSSSLALIVAIVLFPITPFIGRVLKLKIFDFLPMNLLNLYNSIRIVKIYEIGGLVFRQIPFLIGFYLLVSMIMLPIIYKEFSKQK